MAPVYNVTATDFDLPRYTSTPRIYVVASQPRSGSHLLAGMLRSTGEAGVPLEYFHKRHWSSWVKRSGQPNTLAAFRLLCQRRTTPNGVFGVKTHWRQFQYACQLRLENEFRSASFVYITRDDILGQAISLCIASQTGSWVSGQVPEKLPEYSFTAIQNSIQTILNERRNWSLFFAISEIQPLRITYEQLTDEPNLTMLKVAELIGFNWTGEATPATDLQRTMINQEWRERFVATLQQMHEPAFFWLRQFGSTANVQVSG
jgi:LPS sulfotransferase NodH